MKSCNATEGVLGCFNLFAAEELELLRYEYVVNDGASLLWQSSFLDSNSVLRVPRTSVSCRWICRCAAVQPSPCQM